MPNEEDEEELSTLRNFLIPDAQNTLQSAAYRHLRKDFEGAEQNLNLAKSKIDLCLQQLQKDKQDASDEEGEK
ncbi:MAG TPA: hypothetical protein V6D14_10250 [Coleofasciculaceae cyanobacterium]|jgi:hypothetical protein